MYKYHPERAKEMEKETPPGTLLPEYVSTKAAIRALRKKQERESTQKSTKQDATIRALRRRKKKRNMDEEMGP
jgi:hypothetical protein